MHHWEYRVIKSNYGCGNHWFAIHEVYYSQTGLIKMWSENPVRLQGDTKEEITSLIEQVSKAWDAPILEQYTPENGKPTLREVTPTNSIKEKP